MAEIRRDLFFAGMPAIWRLYMAVKQGSRGGRGHENNFEAYLGAINDITGEISLQEQKLT